MKYILIFFLLISTAYSQTTSFNFTSIPTGTEVVSPGRGVEHWNRLSPGPFSIGNNQIEVPAGTTEVPDAYARFSWWEMETAQGVYNWTKFDQFFQACITKQKKASFGIMTVLSGEGIYIGGATSTYPVYVHNQMQTHASTADRDVNISGAWIPNYNSTYYLTAFENLMTAIANHVQNTVYNGVYYRDVLGYVDIRGIGEFGEWHHYPYIDQIYGTNRFPTVATYKRIIDAHKTAFPNYPLLALISGYDPGASANTPAEITHYLLTQSNTWGKYGWRWDSWGQSIYSSILENNPGSFGGMDFDTSIANRYKLAPVGGEPSSWEEGVSDNLNQPFYYLLPAQITQYGAAFFGNGNYTASRMDANAQANIRLASKNAGYRIVLTGGSMTTNIARTVPFNITLNWQNIGIAPVYEKWDVTYELRSGSTVVWKDTSDFQLRHFLPSGSPTASSETFTIPGTVATGTYNLYIIIRDSTQYRDPFPLAINGRQTDGSYILRTGIILSGSGNQIPSVNAGTDISIQLPTNTTTLTGSATDGDGTISTYAWTKISGSGTISSPLTASTGIIGLTEGTSVFRLTVTDNGGATNYDEVSVVVSPAIPDPGTTFNILTTAQKNAAATDAIESNDGYPISVGSKFRASVNGYVTGVRFYKTTNNTGTHIGQLWTSTGTLLAQVTFTGETATGWQEMTLSSPVYITANTTYVVSYYSPTGYYVYTYDFFVTTTANGNLRMVQEGQDGSNGVYIYDPTSSGAAFPNASYNESNYWTDVVFTTATTNANPSANAGVDQTVQLPSNTAALVGSGTDGDGSISSYLWTKVSGPAGGTILNPSQSATYLSNLQAGTYVYRLTVTDNLGATASDDITITVLTFVPTNVAPVANAGLDKVYSLPTDTTTLIGQGIDNDGVVTTWEWTQISGPVTATMSRSDSAINFISGMSTAGNYIFLLTITDEDGATGTDMVVIQIRGAATQYLRPRTFTWKGRRIQFRF